MKKIGLLVLAVVFAMGALGVGYAMWSDTITINGTVNTGNVDLVVKEYSCTYVWKLVDHGIAVTHDSEPPKGAIDWNGPDENGNLEATPVAWACAEPQKDADGEPIDDAIQVTIDNAFPLEMPDPNNPDAKVWVPIKADFLLHYEGSIPVRVQVAELVADNPDVEDFLVIKYFEGVENADGDIVRGDEIRAEALMGQQWHFCKYIWVDIYFDGAALQDANWEGLNDDDEMGGMNLSAKIKGIIKVVQWNEYTPPATD